jgi:hypothetical protein
VEYSKWQKDTTTGKFKAISGYVSNQITGLDWGHHSQYIRSSAENTELMFWDTKTRERIDAQNVNLCQVEFETHSCHYGHSVQAIWPTRTGPSLAHESLNDVKSALGKDVSGVDSDLLNCVAWANNDTVIATGDDKSLIRLYDYPATHQDGHCKIYNGHSEKVTKLSWTRDDSTLISTGGSDLAVMQWKRLDEDPQEYADNEAVEDGDAADSLTRRAKPSAKALNPLLMPPDGLSAADMMGLFEEEADTGVDRAGACLPWKGAVKEPKAAWPGVPDKDLAVENLYV